MIDTLQQQQLCLRSFSLQGTPVGLPVYQRLAVQLRSLVTLTEINLSETFCGAATLLAFSHTLPAMTSLQVLHLTGNSIGDLGAAHLAAALEKNVTLTDLNLSRALSPALTLSRAHRSPCL